MLGANKNLKKDNKLLLLSNLIDWNKISKLLKSVHKNDINPQGGPKAYDNLKMFKAILLQQWHSLSDAELEEALGIRIDFMVFTGFELNDDIPDESTICRFRNKLIEKKLDYKLFNEINRQLEKTGLKVAKAHGAVLDATIIESSARPSKTINIETDREETEIPINIEESKDSDARWLKKGKDSYYGYKGFVVTDDKGFIQTLKVEPANVAEVNQLVEILPEINSERVYADKAYASAANRKLLKNNKFKDRIMYKAARNKELTPLQKIANKLISKRRFIVEQTFGTLKRRFKFFRASYMTKVKVEAQLRLKAICINLLKAINRITEVSYCV